MDVATVLGIVVALGGIVGGMVYEGGHLSSILQASAAVIVFGGTIGACLVQFPLAHVKQAAKDAVRSFIAPKYDLSGLVKAIVEYAQKARREGVVSLEQEAESNTDPFLGRALRLAVDGSESRVVREVMEIAMSNAAEEAEAGAKVLEAAGGYAPTIGIIGAVLGLIHVMENLADPAKLGAGIAVAFVATVYGVGSANIIFLPMAGKMKSRAKKELVKFELIITGIAALVDGENPRLIEQKLQGFLSEPAQGAKKNE